MSASPHLESAREHPSLMRASVVICGHCGAPRSVDLREGWQRCACTAKRAKPEATEDRKQARA